MATRTNQAGYCMMQTPLEPNPEFRTHDRPELEKPALFCYETLIAIN
jgi:hypothetical protein